MSSSEYEKKDVNLNKIILTGVISVIAIVVILVFILDFFTAVTEEIVYEQVLKPESDSLRVLRVRENEILNNYNCLDTARQVYRIPIDQAMQVLADEAYRQSK